MKLRLKVCPPRGTSFDFNHPGPVVRIGRDPAAELHLDGPYQDNVSWNHARITLSDKAATLLDTNSTNGTYLNGNADRLKTVALKVGDEIRLGMTGPRLQVVEVTLAAPTTAGPSRRPPDDFTPPVPPDFARAAPRPASAPPRQVSHTRQLLMLSQERNRRTFAVTTIAFLLLLLVLGWLIWQVDWRRKAGDEMLAGEITKVKEQVTHVTADMQAGHGRLNTEIHNEARKLEARIDELNKSAKDWNEKLRDDIQKSNQQNRKDIITDMEQLNKRIVAKDSPKTPPVAPPAEEFKEKPLEFKTGMKLSIRRKDSSNVTTGVDYKDAVVAMATADELYVVAPLDGRTKIEFDTIATIYSKDQMYTRDTKSGEFVTGVAYFQLDRSAGLFTRVPKPDVDLSLLDKGTVVGAKNIFCFVQDVDGSLMVAVPKREFGSLSINPTSFGEIVTNQGVYTYSESERSYQFRKHTDIAAAHVKEVEQGQKNYEKQKWDRRVQAYQLGTERLKALRPVVWWRWWW